LDFLFSFVRLCGAEGELHFLAQKIDEQRTGDYDTDAAFDSVSRERVDQIAGELGRDDRDCQPPSPNAVLEPTYSCGGENPGKK
jgi:hypothetical protein